ncbi:MAG: type II toxin-antitoxin system mRNA interferase toxin, RelE/StbE family [Candidatus Kapabacteria bacterium]|jgi:addiction module RelE/StbE family toxin|nr:type II toxin-antitoxin system mRNA interferase toxin, RelE/StbE family [Candidatus Kapabacteria bacterium]
MYQFVWEKSFERAFKKVTKNNYNIKSRIFEVLSLMQEDPFQPKLKTHKLHGKLQSLLAASIDFEYRIIFMIREISNIKSIVLIDIGTHDEVY